MSDRPLGMLVPWLASKSSGGENYTMQHPGSPYPVRITYAVELIDDGNMGRMVAANDYYGQLGWCLFPPRFVDEVMAGRMDCENVFARALAEGFASDLTPEFQAHLEAI